MVALLPADIAAEANTLRRDLEDRHRRLVQQQQRYFQPGTGSSSGSLTALLRHSGSSTRFLVTLTSVCACLSCRRLAHKATPPTHFGSQPMPSTLSVTSLVNSR